MVQHQQNFVAPNSNQRYAIPPIYDDKLAPFNIKQARWVRECKDSTDERARMKQIFLLLLTGIDHASTHAGTNTRNSISLNIKCIDKLYFLYLKL